MNTDPCTALASLADRYWQFECHEIPLYAALAGEPGDDPVLFRESQADHARRDRRAGELLAELARIDTAPLPAQQRATARLLERELGAIRSQYAVLAHLRPSLFPAGPDFTAVFWANAAAIASRADAERYLRRLQTLPAYLADVQDNIRAGGALGLRYPRVVLDAALANVRGIVEAPVPASAWLGPFRRSVVAALPAVAALRERTGQFVVDTLLPALQAHAAFLDGLRADARDTLGCADGPAAAHGHAYYRVMVGHYTNGELTPEAIHQLGLDEVARIGGAIEAVAAQAGFAGDVAGYRRHLASDPQFVLADAQALRERLQSLCKRIDRLIPAYFAKLPRITYGVDSMPEAVAARMPPAYAQPSPADGSAAGVFWVSSLPAKCPTYLHVALAVHEAWPGHLMHIALMHEQVGLPAFRRHGAVKYSACIEGWALYCETLAAEMGLYATPHDHYGRLEMELWRALRLVVDTGIHALGWSRQQALDCMAAHLTLSPETLEGEVDRYAALPAQALAYQIGNLKLRALRERAQARLGERFSLRDFHSAVTDAGAVTLPVLDELVEDWLACRAAVAA